MCLSFLLDFLGTPMRAAPDLFDDTLKLRCSSTPCSNSDPAPETGQRELVTRWASDAGEEGFLGMLAVSLRCRAFQHLRGPVALLV